MLGIKPQNDSKISVSKGGGIASVGSAETETKPLSRHDHPKPRITVSDFII